MGGRWRKSHLHLPSLHGARPGNLSICHNLYSPLPSQISPSKANPLKSPLTIILFAIAMIVADAAHAQLAKCFSSDDGGYYQCEYQAIGTNGSFVISAAGKPTYTFNILKPGVAKVTMKIGTKPEEDFPGQFVPFEGQPGCWFNRETKTDLCVEDN